MLLHPAQWSCDSLSDYHRSIQEALAALTQAEHLFKQRGQVPNTAFEWPLDAIALEATFPEGMQLQAGSSWTPLHTVGPYFRGGQRQPVLTQRLFQMRMACAGVQRSCCVQAARQ